MISLARVVEMRPSILISGFLGAGKTTLLRTLLLALRESDIKADVILNDFANAEIDSETLREDAASVEALGASCACCEGMEFLVDMVTKTAQSDNTILLTELNGTADPLPIVESFTLLENKFKLYPRWHVCVIDARHFEQRAYHNFLEKDQLETASHYIISHSEDVSPERLREVQDRLKSILPAATLTTPAKLAKSATELALTKKKCVLNEQNPSPTKLKKSPYHHLSHQFTACQIQILERVEHNDILKWLEALPEQVMRAKALLDLKDDTEKRYLYERIGSHIPKTPYPVPIRGTVPSSAILIGPDLDPEALLELTQSHLTPDASLI
ncbi:GTP-binding protein [Rubritalea spongiae]|uniref:GTP-binding protein n=1 Tax=Rubritalea spongiae TaxID=430797 RepID=A0ABW5DZJ8_9BACT